MKFRSAFSRALVAVSALLAVVSLPNVGTAQDTTSQRGVRIGSMNATTGNHDRGRCVGDQIRGIADRSVRRARPIDRPAARGW